MAAGGSRTVAAAALNMAMTDSREAETLLKNEYAASGVRAVAVDYGGDYLSSIKKLVERAIVAAKREGVIQATHGDEGSVAGATREALSQIMPKAFGLNVGGKISVARQGEHLSVAVFFGVGLLHLDEIAVGLGHRVISDR
ncbi:MAG: HutP family protein [Gracilibacteraceae bacterium]|jgi:hypothetical protein|nr:HutP family protein [Gracilibacteraceae bacterium]